MRALIKKILTLLIAAAVPFALFMSADRAAADDADATIEKANIYIEVAKLTERALESWGRYQSWVNMKTGPTGKERYLSYGMYELHDGTGLFEQARKAAGMKPAVADLDKAMERYIKAYEALAPVMNKAAGYYEQKGYESDGMREGQELHKQMLPLATAFLAEREAMMPPLRVFVRDAEGQEVAQLEKQEGRSAAWQVRNVMHAAARVIDVFPKVRPQEMSGDELDARMQALGPNSSGQEFDAIIAGVKTPPSPVLDVKRYGAALDTYAKAVAELQSFKGEKPEDFDEFRPLPKKLLDLLRAFQEPLKKSEGREFEGGAQLFGQIVQAYFNMFNEGGSIRGSYLRYLD